MKVGDPVYGGVSSQGKIQNVYIEDESILAPQRAIQVNAYYTNLELRAMQPGTTRIVAVSDTGTWYYTVTVTGSGTTATTQTTPQTTTTTTTTTTTETTTTPDNQETETKTLGDINRDNQVDASDAAAVLVAAAKVGSGNASGLSRGQERDADVDGGGDFNAQDASLILRYAAAVGSGYRGSLTAYLKSIS